MLERLRRRPVVGRHHQQRGVNLARANQHVAHQPVMSGDVHEVQLRAIGEREVRVPHVDGHAAPLLLGKPVCVNAREDAQQRGLAVVDVAGGADDDAHDRRLARDERGETPLHHGVVGRVHRAQVADEAPVLNAGEDPVRTGAQLRSRCVRRRNRQHDTP